MKPCSDHAPAAHHAPILPQIIRVFAPTMPQPCPNHTSVDYQITKGSPKTFSQHTRGFILKSEWHENYQSTPFMTVWHLQMSPFWCRMIVKIVITYNCTAKFMHQHYLLYNHKAKGKPKNRDTE